MINFKLLYAMKTVVKAWSDLYLRTSDISGKAIEKYSAQLSHILSYMDIKFLANNISMTCLFNKVVTLTCRCTPRPHSCRETSASTASHSAVACIATVGGSPSICCSRSVTNSAIGWVSQSTTVHSCEKEEHVFVDYVNCRMMLVLYLDLPPWLLLFVALK